MSRMRSLYGLVATAAAAMMTSSPTAAASTSPGVGDVRPGRSFLGMMNTAFFGALGAFFNLILSVGRAPVAMIEGWGGDAAYAGPSMTGVSSALFQRGRHEAGMSRMSAARNT